MIKFNTKTKIVTFTYTKPLNSHSVVYTIGDPKLSFYFKRQADYDFFYVISDYNSDDESGGSVEFQAQSITAIDNGKKRPPIEDLLLITKNSMNEINKAFEEQSAKYGFVFNNKIAAFTQTFTEANFLIEVSKILDAEYQ